MPETMSADDRKRQQEWETEEELRTITRAAKIKSESARMKRVRALARKQMSELKNV